MSDRTEHVFASPVEVEPGILRVTLPLPSGPMHVHTYLLRGDDGWTLVDTGLGLPDSPWEQVAAGLDAPVMRIFITHMHPDHVGGAAPAAEATGAPVLQGRLDYEQCERVWGDPDWPRTIADWFLRQGVPGDVAEELLQSGHVFADFVRFAWNPQPVEPGDEIGGWRVLAVPGHADGHLALLRQEDGVLIAGDSILTPITPSRSRPTTTSGSPRPRRLCRQSHRAASRSRTRSSAARCHRSSAASRSPRRSLTSNGSCDRIAPAVTKTTGASRIQRASSVSAARCLATGERVNLVA
jgi:glyoxylase-like metal-dependent hydrolase (beta-lactamase superfamily II)